MYEGRIVGSFDARTADVHEIGLLMTGGHRRRRSRSRGPPGSAGPEARMTIRLEPRVQPPRWLSPVATLVAVAVALVVSGVIIAIVGGDPIRSYLHILNAAFGSVGVLSDTLVKATPLLLTGLACALAFRMRLWNIGAEGQFLLGAWGASAVVLAPILPAGHAGVHRDPGDDAGGCRGGGRRGA